MRLIAFKLVIFIYGMFMLPIYSIAVNIDEHSMKATYIPIYSIDQRIKLLFTKSDSITSQKDLLLDSVDLLLNELNPAEHYLLLMIKAKVTQDTNKHREVIDILDRARALESQVNVQQLNTSPFIDVYKLLAESYAGLGQYKKAYEAKNTFISKYDSYLLYEKNKHIFELETKYETNRKKDINKLLNNQTILKALEINETLSNETIQRRNLAALSFLTLIFILLLSRLLYINRRIHDLSKEDMLTGIRNRKTLFRYGKSAIRRCQASGSGLCLLAISINQFKLLNNMYGDYIGDEILKKIASIGTESMRNRDVFARLEDAIFIAVLPESSVGETKALAQHLKEKFASLDFSYVGINEPIFVSISIVRMGESLDNFESMLNAGMNVLYELKDLEGNQIKAYQEH